MYSYAFPSGPSCRGEEDGSWYSAMQIIHFQVVMYRSSGEGAKVDGRGLSLLKQKAVSPSMSIGAARKASYKHEQIPYVISNS